MKGDIVIPISSISEGTDKIYRVKRVNVDKIELDVYIIDSKHVHNDLENSKVIKLSEPDGDINLKASALAVKCAALCIGGVISNLVIDIEAKSAIITEFTLIGVANDNQ